MHQVRHVYGSLSGRRGNSKIASGFAEAGELTVMKQADCLSLPLFGSAVILAGGQSRRMGFDKQTIRLGEGTLLDQTVEQLTGLFSDIVIVTNRPALYDSTIERNPQVRVISDVFPGKGPMAGVHAGLLVALSRYVYVIGCDMPQIGAFFIAQMIQALERSLYRPGEAPNKEVSPPAGAMLKRDNGQLEPLNAFYHKNLSTLMEDRLAQEALSLNEFCRTQPFVWLAEQAVRTQDPELRLFQNINDPREFERWRSETADGDDHAGLLTQTVLVRRVASGDSCLMEDQVIREGRLTIELNETAVAILYTLPERWQDLAVGWLMTNRHIAGFHHIESLEFVPDLVNEDNMCAMIRLKPERRTETEMTTVTPCSLRALSSNRITSLMQQLEARAELFRETGSTHNMMLLRYDNWGMIDHCEDVSRHHCLHKLIGRAMKENRNLAEELLVMSCRVTASIVEMMAIAAIPSAVSRSAVTSAALELASVHGIRLIGFARDNRYNLYELGE